MLTQNNKGGFEFSDIFNFVLFGILLFVFVQIFTPIYGLFNFDAMPNGTIIQMLLGFFDIMLIIGFLASYFKKWGKSSGGN